jgi:hypothetical protein
MKNDKLIFPYLIQICKRHANSEPSTLEWSEIDLKLQELAPTYSENDRAIILYWLHQHFTEMKSFTPRYRILHELEQDMVYPDAYAFALEISRWNIISWTEIDIIFEKILEEEGGPITKEQLEKIVIAQWKNDLNEIAQMVN